MRKIQKSIKTIKINNLSRVVYRYFFNKNTTIKQYLIYDSYYDYGDYEYKTHLICGFFYIIKYDKDKTGEVKIQKLIKYDIGLNKKIYKYKLHTVGKNDTEDEKKYYGDLRQELGRFLKSYLEG